MTKQQQHRQQSGFSCRSNNRNCYRMSPRPFGCDNNNYVFIFIFLLVGLCHPQPVAAFDCSTNEECSAAIGYNSTCKVNGKCSNPFESGCLRMLLPEYKDRMRVCNSDDDDDDDDDGPGQQQEESKNRHGRLCRTPDIAYLEMRLFANNWETPVFENWLLQIIFSEILDIPTSMETGTPKAEISLYQTDGRFEYGTTHDTISLEKATELQGECLLASRHPDSYETCAHFVPEIWNIETPWVQELILNRIIEPPQSLGVLGQEGWYITKFTVEQEPSLTSYFGLQGEHNRHKLASMFKRPTTWKQYCETISTSNCTIPDDIAKRYPKTEEESIKMYAEAIEEDDIRAYKNINIVEQDNHTTPIDKNGKVLLYTGYFRYDPTKNNCTRHPLTCTGHAADYPCGWSSPMTSQLYHLQIALESNGDEPGSGGYRHSQLVEMWHAAHHHQENLIMYYWTPESLFQKFLGTPAEMIRISMPTRTQKCEDNRVSVQERCLETAQERAGSPEGVCDEGSNTLYKLISSGLQANIHGEYNPVDSTTEALFNPAYEVLSLFSISELQLSEISDYYNTYPTPREAVCTWAAENIDYLKTFVPHGYPRVVEVASNKAFYYKVIAISLVTLGIITTIYVLVVMTVVYKNRKTRVMRYAQLEFLLFVLVGSFSIGIGAITQGLHDSDISCVVTEWFINIGYTLEIVPSIVKIAAINRMLTTMSNSTDEEQQRRQRTILTKKQLLTAVVCICFLVIPFLISWTILDPPKVITEYDLTTSKNMRNETIVEARNFCGSESLLWRYTAVGWNTMLLFCATVLAYQNRNIHQAFNESRTLGMMIYSHFIFVIFRVILLFLNNTISGAILNGTRSFLCSIDTVFTVTIYFVPKLFVVTSEEEQRQLYSTRLQETSKNTTGQNIPQHEQHHFANDDQAVEDAPVERFINSNNGQANNLIDSS